MDFFERQDKARWNAKLLAVYLVMAAISVLSGCATSGRHADEGLTPDRAAFLYPRQHMESLTPAERALAEQQALEQQNREDAKRSKP